MTGRRLGLILSLAVMGISLAAPTASLAAETITATAGNRFASSVTTIDQGESVTLMNADLVSHNVASKQFGTDGRRLFESDTIGAGESAPVRGTQYLTTGSYPFVCTLHPGMEATLQVTSNGTPVPRPADRTGPRLRVQITSTDAQRVGKTGKLGMKVTSNEKASGTVSAKATISGRTRSLGSVSFRVVRAGSDSVTLQLSSSARRAFTKASSARVRATASGKDAFGNRGSASASRTLR